MAADAHAKSFYSTPGLVHQGMLVHYFEKGVEGHWEESGRDPFHFSLLKKEPRGTSIVPDPYFLPFH